jgi:hypothetical protein
MKFDPVAAKRRFWELVAEKEKIQEKLAPVRREYAKLRQEGGSHKRLAELKKAIRAANPRLVALDQELAFLARGLKNKPGPRPEDLPMTELARQVHASAVTLD